jgi:hypothetical protein
MKNLCPDHPASVAALTAELLQLVAGVRNAPNAPLIIPFKFKLIREVAA